MTGARPRASEDMPPPESERHVKGTVGRSRQVWWQPMHSRLFRQPEDSNFSNAHSFPSRRNPRELASLGSGRGKADEDLIALAYCMLFVNGRPATTETSRQVQPDAG